MISVLYSTAFGSCYYLQVTHVTHATIVGGNGGRGQPRESECGTVLTGVWSYAGEDN